MQLYTHIQVNRISLLMNIVSRYGFGCTGTQAFAMCHQASFHLKLARKYSGLQIRGVKGISALIFWNAALKIKLKGENTLCSLSFHC